MFRFLLLSLAALCGGNCAFANVFRINNSLTTNTSQKLYKTINEANNAAVVLAGDTLMIEGAALEYEDATITKRLVLIGPGYFLTQNAQTQANVLQAVVRSISLNSGASGSVLIGLTFATYYTSYTPYIRVNNILIMRCYMPHPVQIEGNVSNIQIIENYFVTSALEAYYDSYTFTATSLKNNIIGAKSGVSINLTSNSSYQRLFSAVENNIFQGSLTITTSSFRSNVLINPTSNLNISSTSIQNNLVRNTVQLPTTNGNIVYDSASLFVGPTGNSTDGQYQLKPTSPYLTAGFANTQPGIFGGTQSYVLSGLPPIPSIYGFTADGIANKQTGLPINIKVKANQ